MQVAPKLSCAEASELLSVIGQHLTSMLSQIHELKVQKVIVLARRWRPLEAKMGFRQASIADLGAELGAVPCNRQLS